MKTPIKFLLAAALPLLASCPGSGANGMVRADTIKEPVRNVVDRHNRWALEHASNELEAQVWTQEADILQTLVDEAAATDDER